jgi:diketogulonate reductase-like aldo/keto reductase
MQYAHLGRTGLQVSRLGLGTLAFGWKTSEAESFAIMDQALELGIDLIDTANVYGEPQPPADPRGEGITEQIIGRWLAQGGRRERIVLATKVYQPIGSGPNDRGLSAYHIRRACDDSLRRLQTDHIDRNTPWEEIWQAMETLVQQGKVIYVGSSNFAGWHIAAAQAAAATRNFIGLVSEQSKYNLKDRAIELEVIPTCRCLGYFMTIIDVTIVNVALVDIKEHLGANVTGLQWIVDGYALVFASFLLITLERKDHKPSHASFETVSRENVLCYECRRHVPDLYVHGLPVRHESVPATGETLFAIALRRVHAPHRGKTRDGQVL